LSDIENIIQPVHEVEFFGKKYPLSFTFRNYAAIQRKFAKSPIELFERILQGDIEAVICCLWGGTLVFDVFAPEDPLRILEEIELEKIYALGFFDLQKALVPLQLAIMASMPKVDEELAEPEKKPEAPAAEVG
jgi:hypothetical protein